MASNPVGWFEIYVQDMSRAKAFYESVFKTQFQRLESPGIEMWAFSMQPDVNGASGALVRMEGVPSGGNSTIVYFICEDCSVEAKRASTQDGKIFKEKFSNGQYGFIALVNLQTMKTSTWSVRRLHALDDAQIDALADVLIDCVDGGASVSFMCPLTHERAVAFWHGVAQGVAAGERALLVAEDAHGICGTVHRFESTRKSATPRRTVEDAGASTRALPRRGGGGVASCRSRSA